VATVNNGVVTAVGAGNAIIIVSTQDGGKTATSNVTVTGPVAGVSLNLNTLSLSVGGTSTLIATIQPANAANQAVTWSSNNTSVATVNNNGMVTAISAGNATITVTTVEGNRTATCAVTVVAAGSVDVPVTGVALAPPALNLTVGGATATLTSTVNPSNATNKNVNWSSSDTSVAIVNNGVVTAVGAGNATITVSTQDGGKTASSAVTVTAPVTGVNLNLNTLSLNIGGTSTLIASVLPANATNRNITWSSNNTGVATVNSNGVVTAVAAGNATIIVTTVEGGRTATCTVTVNPAAVNFNSVTLDSFQSHVPAIRLFLTFSQAISGLTADHITLSGLPGEIVSRLHGTGPTYTLDFHGFTAGGTLTVAVASPPGFNISGSPRTVTIPPILTGTVSITGGAQVGQTLTANINNLGGNGAIAYYWLRGGILNVGSDSNTYTIQQADVGSTISLGVTRTGNSGSVISSPTAIVTAPTTYTLTVNRNPTTGGSTIPANQQQNIVERTPVNISATANNGFQFVNWTVSSGTAIFERAYNENTTVLLFSNATIVANFQPTPPHSEFTFNPGTGTITGYTGTGGSVTIPREINGIPVRAISDSAFLNRQLTSVTFANPSNITSIGHFAFMGNQLSSVTIPNGVTVLYWFVFADNQLQSVTIPNGVTVISEEAFSNNPLTSITIGSGVEFEMVSVWGFPFGSGFEATYINGGRLAGRYTRPNTSSTIWTRQP
jgi:uncharacterized protein YjdB